MNLKRVIMKNVFIFGHKSMKIADIWALSLLCAYKNVQFNLLKTIYIFFILIWNIDVYKIYIFKKTLLAFGNIQIRCGFYEWKDIFIIFIQISRILAYSRTVVKNKIFLGWLISSQCMKNIVQPSENIYKYGEKMWQG